MQRRQHQVAGERRLDTDARRFLVADFADHDHVRILPQHAPQRAGECQTDCFMHVGLIDHVELIFDWIFNRHNIQLGAAQKLQGRVERGGFAAAGRAGDQHQPVRLLQASA